MKNITKALACVAAIGAATVTASTPVVSNVTMTQSDASRLVTITYQLTEDAVVTLDVMTNATPNAATGWASIGGEAICNAEGAVWRKVTSADADGNGNYTITWRPDLSWTDEFGKGFKIANGCAKAVVKAWALDNTPNYMVVDISAAAQPNTQKYYPGADFVPGGVSSSLYKTTTLLMRKIMAKGVTWTMGSVAESGRNVDREATHQVMLTNNYYIGVYEVTQTQWQQITGYNNSYYTGERAMRPVDKVNYNEIRIYGNSESSATAEQIASYSWPRDPSGDSFLGKLRNRTAIDFDLPSDAQWEFAARSGNGEGSWNDGSAMNIKMSGGNALSDTHLALLGRYASNGGKTSGGTDPAADCGVTNGSAIVGSYLPNDWGIYDMHGNVWEWCLDWQQDNIGSYDGKININPSAPAQTLSGASGATRVTRSGSWMNIAGLCRAAFRSASAANSRNKHYGLRVVCTAGLR